MQLPLVVLPQHVSVSPIRARRTPRMRVYGEVDRETKLLVPVSGKTKVLGKAMLILPFAGMELDVLKEIVTT